VHAHELTSCALAGLTPPLSDEDDDYGNPFLDAPVGHSVTVTTSFVVTKATGTSQAMY
jgi:hypothetical protein